MILTPIPEQVQQQQENQDFITMDIDDNNVEALLFNYLQLQQHPPDVSPSPVSNHLPIELLSPSLFGSPLTAKLASTNSTTSNSSFDPNNNVFQSPQLPYSSQFRHQSESDTGSLINLYTPPPLSTTTFYLQQQKNAITAGESWGQPLLDMLQATMQFDDGFKQSNNNKNNNNSSNSSNSNNDNDATVDTSVSSPSLFYSTTAPAKQNTTDTMNIRLEVNSYTDLKNILQSMQTKIGPQFSEDDIQQHRRKRRRNRKNNNMMDMEQQQQERRRRAATAAAEAASMNNILPVAVRDTVDTAFFLPLLMEKAQMHWCCVGFKIAPVTLDVVRHWREAPITIIYSVAAIVLVTIMDHNAGQAYAKTAAMVFYEQARRKMDDVVFDDEDDISNYYLTGDGDYDDEGGGDDMGDRKKAMTIQSYFCLSYTSNLLRLYDQQRTWGGLASIALQIRTKDAESGCRPMDQAILLCYCRWYYVDAWMALTLQRECLLSETPPQFILDIIQRSMTDDGSSTKAATQGLAREHQSLYHFAILAKFMRRFIRVLRSDKLMDPVTMKPSSYYYAITNELQRWYQTVQQQQTAVETTTTAMMVGPRASNSNQGGSGVGSINNDYIGGGGGDGGGGGINNGDDPGSGVHLHLCYNAMRLVIIYKFLHPEILDPDDTILMDALETNLTILQSLQQLALQGCDQSTYHYIYYAIHNTATRIYQCQIKRRNTKWQRWARQQLQINLVLLKGTQAYLNDVFQIREYAAKIEEQFKHTGLTLSPYYRTTLASMEKQQQLLQYQRTYVTNYTNYDDDNDVAAENVLSPAAMDHRRYFNEHQPTGHLNLKYDQPSVISSSSSSLPPKSKEPATAPTTTTTTPAPTASMLPGMHVYKLLTAPTIKKPRKMGKSKQTKQ